MEIKDGPRFVGSVQSRTPASPYHYSVVDDRDGVTYAILEEEMTLEPVQLPGVKHDAGKSRLDLIPFRELLQVGDVLEYGARKYAPDNWKHVPEARQRYLGAALRHIAAHGTGEVLDPESGLPHLAHAITSLFFLLHFVNNGD